MNTNKTKWINVFTRAGFPLFLLNLAIEGYIYDMRKKIGWGYRDQLFISKKNIESSYYSARDRESFKKFVSSKQEKEILKINKIIKNIFIVANKEIIKVNKYLDNNNLEEALGLFYKIYRNAYSIYRFTTHVDELGNNLSKKILSDCAKTKDLCGNFFSKTDTTILEELKKKLSKKLKVKKDMVLLMNYPELKSSLEIGRPVINEKELKKRFNFLTLIAIDSKIKLLTGSKARNLKNKLKIETYNRKAGEYIKGQSVKKANKVIRGCVKIVHTPLDFKKIKKDFILVTPMTTLNFLPFLKKAAAIVTDEGGVTCHAAIISRELGIPCIIGTKIATQILKDGDLVEVNANHGWVRKIK